jgi:hypothetical protein
LYVVREDFMRFRSLCRMRGTEIQAAVRAIIVAEVAHPSVGLMSELLPVHLSAEQTDQLCGLARLRRVSPRRLAEQAFARMPI